MHRTLATLVSLCLGVFFLAPSPTNVQARSASGPAPVIEPAPAPMQAPRPAAPPTYAEGIDVSHHQGAINWARVAGSGKLFAFIRASAGTLTADGQYAANLSGAHSAGLAVGSYHFANPDTASGDAANEAAWFLQNATIASGDLRPVLDLEVSNGLDPASMTAWAQTWLSNVSSATGVRPIIYTNPTFWSTSMANTDWFARNGYSVLWIAHWTKAAQPLVPAANWAGQGWSFWQYSSTGKVSGVSGRVDLNRFNGSTLPAALFVP
jgi:GH25 family lysozyme M1 (1,4-beta-N-acetylmuramidase)